MKCTVITPFLKADNCDDGGSKNKLFYKTALSLKQFVLDEPPIDERLLVLKYAYKRSSKSVPTAAADLASATSKRSAASRFHMKPYSNA